MTDDLTPTAPKPHLLADLVTPGIHRVPGYGIAFPGYGKVFPGYGSRTCGILPVVFHGHTVITLIDWLRKPTRKLCVCNYFVDLGCCATPTSKGEIVAIVKICVRSCLFAQGNQPAIAFVACATARRGRAPDAARLRLVRIVTTAGQYGGARQLREQLGPGARVLALNTGLNTGGWGLVFNANNTSSYICYVMCARASSGQVYNMRVLLPEI